MKFTPNIAALPSTTPFVGPEALTRRTGHKIKARIGANESVFGPSPKVIKAMQAAALESWAYGDPEHYDLKAAIAAHHGVSPDNIACGEGIDGLLGLVVRLFIDAGDVVATSLGAYPTFNFHVAASGGKLVTTPYVDDHEHPVSLIKLAAEEKAKLLYIANPDNPMGTHWPAREIKHMIDHLPESCMMLLDEAYIDFAPEGTAPAIDVNHKIFCAFVLSPKHTASRVCAWVIALAMRRSFQLLIKSEIISAFRGSHKRVPLPRLRIKNIWPKFRNKFRWQRDIFTKLPRPMA